MVNRWLTGPGVALGFMYFIFSLALVSAFLSRALLTSYAVGTRSPSSLSLECSISTFYLSPSIPIVGWS